MSHPALDVAALRRRLRDAGLAIGVDPVASFAAALPLVDALARRDVYFAVFDDELARWLVGDAPSRVQEMPMAPRHDLRSLQSLARHLARIPRRRGGHISGVHVR